MTVGEAAQALEMMGGAAGHLSGVRAYALRSLQSCPSEEVRPPLSPPHSSWSVWRYLPER